MPDACNVATERDPRWAAVLGRDPAADGRFYYAVLTTQIYCRPSCPARRPRPGHVRFYTQRADAERDGFRPCRRCRPDALHAPGRHTAALAHACRAIEAANAPPRLDELAAAAGLSPGHFHRLFRRATGLTPRDYTRACREARLRHALHAGAGVTEAAYAAGYASSGHFYAQADAALGMTPARYRAGGAGVTVHFALAQSTLGAVLVARSERGLCAVDLGDDPEALVRGLRARFPHAQRLDGDPEFARLVAQVVRQIEAPGCDPELPLDLRGTLFQQRVWQALRAIPPGTTRRYTELARELGAPGAARAVARACAGNPLAVVIPCHRVVRGDGGLAGYRWGVERKRRLIEQEAGAAGEGDEKEV